jgi:hypothetical protein
MFVKQDGFSALPEAISAFKRVTAYTLSFVQKHENFRRSNRVRPVHNMRYAVVHANIPFG